MIVEILYMIILLICSIENDQSFIFIVYFDYSKDCKYNECNSNVLIRKETD